MSALNATDTGPDVFSKVKIIPGPKNNPAWNQQRKAVVIFNLPFFPHLNFLITGSYSG